MSGLQPLLATPLAAELPCSQVLVPVPVHLYHYSTGHCPPLEEWWDLLPASYLEQHITPRHRRSPACQRVVFAFDHNPKWSGSKYQPRYCTRLVKPDLCFRRPCSSGGNSP